MQRRVKRRHAARVLVVADGQVLLQQDSDPGVPGVRWWTTPGGGIDGDETPREAARRELWEETGLRAAEADLVGPVATRFVRHGYSDRVLLQHETFFRIDAVAFEPAPKGLTSTELTRLVSQAWFPLGALPEVVWPDRLPKLLAWRGGPVIDLGEMDESTVP